MSVRPICLFPSLLCAVLTAGCQPSTPEGAVDETAPGALHVIETTMVDSLDDALTAAIDALVAERGLTAGDITVLRADNVTWSDGALGCPSPGMVYTQALVPGYLIELEAGGARYRYHGARDRRPHRCPAERAREPVPGVDR